MGYQRTAAYHKHRKQKHDELGLEQNGHLEEYSLANIYIKQHTHLYLVVITITQIMYRPHYGKQIYQ